MARAYSTLVVLVLYKNLSNQFFLKLKFLLMPCYSYYGATYYGSRGIGEPTEIKGLHPCLRDLANTRIREPDSQEMAGSCLAREKIRFSGLVCSRLAFLI